MEPKVQRLRPKWSDEGLSKLYSGEHDYRGWQDHRLRIPVTQALAAWMIEEFDLKSAADLSAGDGALLEALPVDEKVWGDIVSNPFFQHCGPIEETILEVQTDLLVCGETIEHLDDPQAFFKNARKHVKAMALSTPVGSWNDDTPGHYWAWNREYVEQMLGRAGFEFVTYTELSFSAEYLPHTFGIWGLR